MNRTEFIDKLQRALAGGLNSSLVAENVRYYQEYIDSEVRKGRREEEVLSQLGDPRLLAKSIIEANKHAGESYGSNHEYDEEVADDTQEWRQEGQTGGVRRIVFPGWLVMLIVTVLVLLVIGVATVTLVKFAPVIIIVLLVVLAVKVFQGRSR